MLVGQGKVGCVLIDDVLLGLAVELAEGGDHASSSVLETVSARNRSTISRGLATYLAFIAMNEHWMTRSVLQDHLNLGDLIERIDAIPRLVRNDWDPKMRNPVRFDIVSGFQSVGLFDEGAIFRESPQPWMSSDGDLHDSLQLQRLQMVQIAWLRKAAPVDTCRDSPEIDDLASVRSRWTSWLDG